MNVLIALEAMEGAPQGNARLEALKKYDSPELRRCLELALSPDTTFGVKKLPAPAEPPQGTQEINATNDSNWYNTLLDHLHDLSERTLSGGAAQEALATFFARCSPLQLKWTQRILRQDLRINVGAKDVNKALGANTIPLFEVPLATDYSKLKAKELEGQWALQPKLDGGRCVAFLPACGRVKLMSRTGKEWGNFESIRAVLQRWNDRRDGVDTYLDGEVISVVDGRIDFQATQKTMMRKDGVEVGTLVYACFDAASAQEWRTPSLPYQHRIQMAADAVTDIGEPQRISIVPSMKTQLGGDDSAVALLRANCDNFVAQGYEGAMARRLDLPVENKRGKRLLKVKTFLDDEAVVVGAVEGTGKYEGMLGALQCRTKRGKDFEIGSGFDDKQRAEIWFMWKQSQSAGTFNKMTFPALTSFKYQELTDDEVPRFPIFRGFRSEDDC